MAFNEAYVKPLLYITQFIGSVLIVTHFANHHSKYGAILKSRKSRDEKYDC